MNYYHNYYCDSCQTTTYEPISNQTHATTCPANTVVYSIVPLECLDTNQQFPHFSESSIIYSISRVVNLSEVFGTDPNKERLFPEPEQHRCGNCYAVYNRSSIVGHHCEIPSQQQSNPMTTSPNEPLDSTALSVDIEYAFCFQPIL